VIAPADVGIHLGLESCGAVTLRCALGLCQHVHHEHRRKAAQAAIWAAVAIPSSILTVALVG
jgi:hypothetical protein